MKELAISLVCAHFVGDWLLQWPSMAANKWKSFRVLSEHVAIISVTLLVFIIPHLLNADDLAPILFKVALNGILHGIIDWNVWRVYNKLCGTDEMGNPVNKLEDIWFWKFIAVDQFLHLVILLVLFL